MIFLLYAIIGCAAGFFAGLFGIGGGLIVVPALLPLFAVLQIDPAIMIHLAVGTSMATIVVTSLSSMRAHHRKGNIQWYVFRRYGLGLALGAVLGAVTADMTPGPYLQAAFAVFAWTMAVQLAFGKPPAPTRQLPGGLAMSSAGAGIGWISSLFGVGGGAMSVPYLIYHNVTAQRAVGTSAAGGFPIAVAGAAGYLWLGQDVANLPDYAVGYVYLPAFLSIAVLSIPMAQVGAHVASQIPARVLKRVFAVFLLFVGAALMFGR